MLRLGLTGSIATGKSTLLSIFAELGVPVFSADEAVHALYADEAVAPVEALFPGVSHLGKIDREQLSRRLVGHPERLAALEAIVHPRVRKRVAAFLESAEKHGAPFAIVDIPLLFETGFDYGLDRIIVTVVDAAEQRRRALARPGMSVEKLEAILARQMPQAEKLERADYVFDSSLPVAEMREAAAALIAKLKAETRAG
ncbi:MAG: dephospho-CoA kinase [Devosia sp.]